MGLRRPRKPGEILEEARRYEKVLVPCGSIRDVLAAHRDEPGTQLFYTPSEPFYSGEADWRRRMFVRLSRDVSWRKASFLLDAATTSFREAGGTGPLRDSGMFEEKDLELLEEVLESVENPMVRMARSDLEGDVAAVGTELMTPLERSVLPGDHGEIPVFDGESVMPEIQLFSSSGALAEEVAEAAVEGGPGNVSVMAPEDSELRSVLESRLDAMGVEHGPRDDPVEMRKYRRFVNFLRIGLSHGEARIGDVKPVLREAGIDHPSDGTRKLDSVDSLEEFRELLSMVPYLELGELMERYSGLVDPGPLPELLEELELESDEVSEETVSELEYAAEEMVQSRSPSSGVEFVDPSNRLVGSRPTVFLLGLDRSWNPGDEDWPWTDPAGRSSRERRRLELQLGWGDSVNICTVEEESRELSGCVQLHEILDEDFRRFSDLDHREVLVRRSGGGDGFEHQPMDVEPGEVEMLSQSALGSLALSPRLYFFSRLVPEETEVERLKGRLFHDYAEFRVSHPEKIEDTPEDELVEMMMEELRAYAEAGELERIETELRLGTRNINGFLDSLDFSRKRPEGYESRRSSNFFTERFEAELRSESTELSFRDREMGARGKIDLMPDSSTLVDYKSGRMKSAQEVFRSSHPDLYGDERYPDFQALMYLSRHRKLNPDEELEFVFFHFLDDIQERASGSEDLERGKVSLTCYPEGFAEKAASKQFYRELTEGVAASNDRRKTLEKLGYEKYAEVAGEIDSSEMFSKEDAEGSGFRQRLEEVAKEEVGDYKYVEKGVKSAARKLSVLRTTNYYSEDVQRFRAFLEQKLEELNGYLGEGFPLGDRKIEELPRRDLLLP